MGENHSGLIVLQRVRLASFRVVVVVMGVGVGGRSLEINAKTLCDAAASGK